MTWGWIFLGLGAVTALQALLARFAPALPGSVDLFLVFLAAIARRGTATSSVAAGAAAGALEDALGGSLFGLHAFAKTLLGYLLATVSVRLLVDHPLAIGLALAGGVLAETAIVAGLRELLAQPPSGITFGAVATRAVGTAAAGLVAEAIARYPWRERWNRARMRRLRR